MFERGHPALPTRGKCLGGHALPCEEQKQKPDLLLASLLEPTRELVAPSEIADELGVEQ